MDNDQKCPICGSILSIYERADVQEKLRRDIFEHGVQNEITSILLKFLFTPGYDPQDCSPEARRGIEILKQLLAGHISTDRSDKRVLHPVEVLFLLVIRLLLTEHLAQDMLTCDKNRFRCQTALMVLDATNNAVLKNELQDYFFSFLSPSTYRYIQSRLPLRQDKVIKAQVLIQTRLTSLLKKLKITANIETRIKSIYSIFRKTQRKNLAPEEIDDILGFRIITHSLEDCYRILEVLQKKWGGRHQRIQDYISTPKESGYQSLHLHVHIKNIPVEFQIRDTAMHHMAERGSAAHGEYKISGW